MMVLASNACAAFVCLTFLLASHHPMGLLPLPIHIIRSNDPCNAFINAATCNLKPSCVWCSYGATSWSTPNQGEWRGCGCGCTAAKRSLLSHAVGLPRPPTQRISTHRPALLQAGAPPSGTRAMTTALTARPAPPTPPAAPCRAAPAPTASLAMPAA